MPVVVDVLYPNVTKKYPVSLMTNWVPPVSVIFAMGPTAVRFGLPRDAIE